MIIIDIPMPKRCADCPCSYYIQTGIYEGMMMCNAMEFKQSTEFGTVLRENFIVEEDHQPSNCPIKSELILGKDERIPGKPVNYRKLLKLIK